MRTMRILKSERGDALLAVIAVAALGVLMTFSMVSSVVYMYKMQKSMTLNDIQDEAERSINLMMADYSACSDAMGPANIAPSMAAGAQNVPNPVQIQIKPNGYAAYAVLGGPTQNEIMPGITVTQVNFVRTSNDGGTPIGSLTPADFSAMPAATVAAVSKMWRGELRIRMKKTNDSLFATEYRETVIPVYVATDAGNNLKMCQTKGDNGAQCEQMGMIYNPFAPAGLKCLPMGACQYGGTYAEGPASEGGFPNPVLATLGLPIGQYCPPNYAPYLKGNVSYGQSCGKYCVSQATHPVYECSICIGADGKSIIPTNGATSSVTGLDFNALGAGLDTYVPSTSGYSLFGISPLIN